MRRSPSSWDGLLAQLGFRRVKRRRTNKKPIDRRRAHFETLEDRRVLASDVLLDAEFDRQWRANVEVAAATFNVGDFTLTSADWTGKSSSGRAVADGHAFGLDSGQEGGDAAAFDPGEAWSMRFDRDGRLTMIDFEGFTVGDADKAQLIVGNSAPIAIEASQVRRGIWRPAEPISFAAGETLRIVAIEASADDLQKAAAAQLKERETDALAGRTPRELSTPNSTWRIRGVHVLGPDDGVHGGYIGLARKAPTAEEIETAQRGRREQRFAPVDDDEEQLAFSEGADVQLTSFTPNDSYLRIGYANNAHEEITQFDIRIYRSENGTTPTGAYVGTMTVSPSSASGYVDWEVDLGAEASLGDYYLLAKIENATGDTNAANNTRVFDGGVFLDANSNIIHFQGAKANVEDSVTLNYYASLGEYEVTWSRPSESNVTFERTGAVAGFHVRSHDGSDTVTASQPGLAVPLRAFLGGGNNSGYGGGGNDYFEGESGIQTFYGGAGNDEIHGGDSYDPGASGTGYGDYLLGEAGDDVIHGSAGPDWIEGGDGDDLIYGGDEYGPGGYTEGYGDWLLGGLGDDVIFGGHGQEYIDGGDGQDLLYGDAGNDSLYGGPGNDISLDSSGTNSRDWGNTGGAHDDLIVNTLVDENETLGTLAFSIHDLSLREALAVAAAVGGADRIVYDPLLVGETQLVGSALSVISDVSIVGPGAQLVTLRAASTKRIFTVAQGGAVLEVSISGLTMTGGSVTDNGGAIQSTENLTLDGVVVVGNATTAIGGGVYQAAGGNLTIRDSSIEGNDAVHGGGAFVHTMTGDELIIERSIFHGNDAIAGAGGGLHFQPTGSGAHGTAWIFNSTFSQNRAVSNGIGGGLYLRAEGSTTSNIEIINSTIAENEGDWAGGLISPDDAVIELHNTILAGNISSGADDFASNGSDLALASSHNVFGPGSDYGPPTGTGNQFNVSDAGLLPLGYYGGTTKTHALKPTSVAINTGDNDEAEGDYDQRGENRDRVLGSVVDVGAFEAHVRQQSSSTAISVYGTSAGDAINIGRNSAAQYVVTLDAAGGYEFVVGLATAASTTVYAGDGDDIVSVDPAVTVGVTLEGGDGNDALIGGSGNDILRGQDGVDVLQGGSGDDYLYGGEGGDFLDGQSGADYLYGDDGNDQLIGGAGNDHLFGGGDDDNLTGGDGDDDFDGEAGFDRFISDGIDTSPPANDNAPPRLSWVGSPTQKSPDPFKIHAQAGAPVYFQAYAHDPDGDPVSYEVKTVGGTPITGSNQAAPYYDSTLGYFIWLNPPSSPTSVTFELKAFDPFGNSSSHEVVISFEEIDLPPSLIAVGLTNPASPGLTQRGASNAFDFRGVHLGSYFTYDEPRRYYSNYEDSEALFQVTVYDPDSDLSDATLTINSEYGDLTEDSRDHLGGGLYVFTLHLELPKIFEPEDYVCGTNDIIWDEETHEDFLELTRYHVETYTVSIDDDGQLEASFHLGFGEGSIWYEHDMPHQLQYAEYDSVYSAGHGTQPDATYTLASFSPFIFSVPSGTGEIGSPYVDFLDAVSLPANGTLEYEYIDEESQLQWEVLESDPLPLVPESETLQNVTRRFRFTPLADFFRSDGNEFQYRFYSDIDEIGKAHGLLPAHIESNIAIIRFVPSVALQLTYYEAPEYSSPPTCNCSCQCGMTESSGDPIDGRVKVSQILGGMAPVSNMGPQEPVVAELKFSVPNGAPDFDKELPVAVLGETPPEIELKAYAFGGGSGTTVGEFAFGPSNYVLKAGVPQTSFVPLTMPGAQSGYHKFSVNYWSSFGGVNHAFSSPEIWAPVIQQDDIGFGMGWNLAGIERLIVHPESPGANPIFWIRDDSSILTIPALDSPTSPALRDPDYHVLSTVGDDFRLRDKYGNMTYFNEDGWITQRVDLYGNTTDYAYHGSDQNGDGKLNDIATITTSIDNHVVTFGWVGGRVTTITDFAGRVVTLGYDGDNLTSIELPDPDGAEPYEGPTSYISYDDEHRVNGVTDPDGKETAYSYDGNVLTTTYDDDTTTTLVFPDFSGYGNRYVFGSNPLADQPLPLFASSMIDFGLPVLNRTGSYTDELGRVTTFEVDGNGFIDKVIDPAGTIYESDLNSVGLPLSTIVRDGPTNAVLDETTFTYDARFNRLSQTHADDVETWTYDATSRPTSYTDPIGRKTVFTYTTYTTTAVKSVATRQIVDGDDRDYPGQAPNDVVFEQHFFSDGMPSHTVARLFDPLNTDQNKTIETRYAYTNPNASPPMGEPAGRWLESITYAYGSPDEAVIEVLARDAYGNPARVSDPEDREMYYEYDALDRLTLAVAPDPDGGGSAWRSATIYRYMQSFRPFEVEQTSVDVTDPLTREFGEGIVTRYEYDDRHRVTDIYQDHGGVGKLNQHVHYEYDAAGNLTRVLDPLGRATSYQYDAVDRPIFVTQENTEGPSSTTAFAYDALGRLLGVTDPRGAVTRYAYDDHHRVTRVAGPLGSGTVVQYDDAGQARTVTDALGRTTTFEYDEAGRAVATRLPGQSSTPITSVYDSLGQLRQRTDQLGHTTKYEYDHLGRVVKEIDANDQETLFTYYDDGQIESLTDPNGNTTTWTYDAAGRLATETNELSEVRAYRYDEFNRLVQLTDREARVTTYEYDNLHRLQAEKWYANQSHLETTPGSPLHAIDYDYNIGNELTGVGDAFADYGFDYDGLGRVTEITALLAGLADDIVFAQEFDVAGNRTKLSAAIDGTANFVNDYAYDALHRLTQVKQYGASVAEKRIDFSYLADGRFSQIRRYADLAGTEFVAQSDYSYNAQGLLSGLVHKQGGTTIAGYGFAYDDALRLTQFTSSQYAAETATYSYDDRGQLTGADRTVVDETYAYDDNGNRNNGGFTPDTNNRLATDGTYNYSYDDEGNVERRTKIGDSSYTDYGWDHRNRLVSITDRTSGHVQTQKVTYSYDAFNRLVKRTFQEAAIDPVTTGFFVHDGDQIVLELESDGDVAHRLLWGPVVDMALADETGAGTTYWGFADHLGTVRDVATYNAGTNVTTVANHIAFDSFGRRLSETNSALGDFDLGFTGKWLDRDTGLQWNINRWYNPSIQRWMSEDPIGFRGRDPNLSRYVENQAQSASDPIGLESKDYYPLWDPRGYFWFLLGWERRKDGSWNQFGSPKEAMKPLVADTMVALPPTRACAIAGGGFDLIHQGLGNVTDLRKGEPLRGIDTSSTTNMVIVGGAVGPVVIAYPGLGYPAAGVGGVLGINNIRRGEVEQGTFELIAAGGVLGYGLMPPRQTPVTRWGRPGLQHGDWIMQGNPCPQTWVLSGKVQPGLGNQFAPYGQAETYTIPREYIVWPSGWGIDGRWKGILGQRKYVGPDILLPIRPQSQ